MRLLNLARAAVGRLNAHPRWRKVAPAQRPRREGIEFVHFGATDIEIAVAAPVVSDQVRNRLIAGTYEKKEARSIPGILDRDEIVVELGAGVGVISTIAMRSGKARQVNTFEADERLIPLIEATHKRNGLSNTRVHHFAITGDKEALARGYIDLTLKRNFPGNSTKLDPTGLKTSRVPTKSLAAIIAEFHPTVLIVDIEGAEEHLFTGVDLSGVKRVSIEIHPHRTGAAGVRRVFDDLHAAGLVYDARHAHGAVPVFSRS